MRRNLSKKKKPMVTNFDGRWVEAKTGGNLGFSQPSEGRMVG